MKTLTWKVPLSYLKGKQAQSLLEEKKKEFRRAMLVKITWIHNSFNFQTMAKRTTTSRYLKLSLKFKLIRWASIQTINLFLAKAVSTQNLRRKQPRAQGMKFNSLTSYKIWSLERVKSKLLAEYTKSLWKSWPYLRRIPYRKIWSFQKL